MACDQVRVLMPSQIINLSDTQVIFKTVYPAVVLRGLYSLTGFLLSHMCRCGRQVGCALGDGWRGPQADAPGQHLSCRSWW